MRNTAEDGLPLPQRCWAMLTLVIGLVVSVLDTAIGQRRPVDLGHQCLSTGRRDFAVAAGLARRRFWVSPHLRNRPRGVHEAGIERIGFRAPDRRDQRHRSSSDGRVRCARADRRGCRRRPSRAAAKLAEPADAAGLYVQTPVIRALGRHFGVQLCRAGIVFVLAAGFSALAAILSVLRLLGVIRLARGVHRPDSVMPPARGDITRLRSPR